MSYVYKASEFTAGEICELDVFEIDAIDGGNKATAGEVIGGFLVGVGLALAPETLGAGLVFAAVGGVILGYSAAADYHSK